MSSTPIYYISLGIGLGMGWVALPVKVVKGRGKAMLCPDDVL